MTGGAVPLFASHTSNTPHLPQESLADQLEEGYRQAIWLPSRGRLQPQPGGGEAARLDLSSHVDKGLYALFASGKLTNAVSGALPVQGER